MTNQPPLILSSGSPYRAALLERLGLPFEQSAPGIDESPRDEESPEAYVLRLAREKARAATRPGALLIGSDQVAVLDGRILGKPGSRERAEAQLLAASGRRIRFFTGLCLYDSRYQREWTDVVRYDVVFRRLDTTTVQRYVARDQPLDCAGSFKAEGLGIALFERMEGDDPTALVGLPLIRLVDFLQLAGIAIP